MRTVLIGLLLLQLLGAQSPPGVQSCRFAWYWVQTSDDVSQDLPPRLAGVNGAISLDTFDSVVNHEGTPFFGNLLAPLTPGAFWCTAQNRYYRWQSAGRGLPYLRAETFAPRGGDTILPGRWSEGAQMLVVWLADENPGCIRTSRFRGRAKPQFHLNVRGVAGTNGRLEGIVSTALTERFVKCSAADNEVARRFVLESDGTQTVTQLRTGIPLGLGATVTFVPGSTSTPWSVNERFESFSSESPWVATRWDRMVLRGTIQSQLRSRTLSVPGSSASALHVAVWDSAHGAFLEWEAEPSTEPNTPEEPTPGGGGTTPSGGGGSTPGGGGGSTPGGTGGSTPGGGGIPTIPWTGPLPPPEMLPPPGTIPDPSASQMDSGYIPGGGHKGSPPAHPLPGGLANSQAGAGWEPPQP